jgi:hypothetical protein
MKSSRALLLASALGFITGLSSIALSWELSDVSVLLPLPKDVSARAKLISTQDAGAMGPMVDSQVLSQLPQLVASLDRDEVYTSFLRVVAIRFDPCFTEGVGPVSCRRQVRIVWQPLIEQNGAITSVDASLHTFYEFSQADWDQLIVQYRDILLANPIPAKTALQVNPRIKAQGFDGAFYKALRKLVLTNCGSKNLVRATVMTREASVNEWQFMGFENVGGRLLPIKIAGIGTEVQRVKTIAPRGSPEIFELRATVTPNVFSASEAMIYADSSKALQTQTEAELVKFAEVQLQIENPGRGNPGTIDCASCHLGSPAGKFARTTFPNWDWKSLLTQSGWSSNRDISNPTASFLKPRRMRALGYFFSDPLFSQRTINESAVVADSLELTVPVKP